MLVRDLIAMLPKLSRIIFIRMCALDRRGQFCEAAIIKSEEVWFDFQKFWSDGWSAVCYVKAHGKPLAHTADEIMYKMILQKIGTVVVDQRPMRVR